jgi:Carboxypeptidase regulatory-like domain/TonB dependent receptor
MRQRLATTLILALVAVTVTVQAQTFRGAINGTVTDPSGAVVSGAKVKATNNATGVILNTVTTTDGQFAFQDLPLGTYKVEVSASGFRPTAVDNIAVTAGSAYTLPVKLATGTTTTLVEVSAAALSLDTTTATQDNTIPTQAITDVPMNGRDFSQFIAVQPGYGGYSVGGFGSLNGTRANQMNWQIDGVDNNDFWHNIPAVNQGGVSGIAGVVMPLDAIDEFSAQTQSNAEGGRNAGGIVNVVLKSGGNTIHGSAYYFNRNEAFGSASPFTPTGVRKPELRNENYGFTVGGPIIKDKTFWFVGYEKQQYIIGLSGVATEPSFAYQNAALALLNNAGIPESPISKQLIANLWPSTIDNLSATIGNFFSPVASTGYSYNGVIKLDHNFNEKNHLSARWFGGQGSQTAPLGGSPALATASSNLSYYFEKAPIHVYNYAITLNSVLTPSLTNQVLFGVNYFNQTFNDANHSFDTHSYGLYLSPDTLIHNQPILGAPNFIIGGFEQTGLTPPEGRNDITGMLADIVSYTVGKHQIRLGGEFRQGHVDEFYYRHSLGSFTFDGSQGPWPACATGNQVCANTNALADFLAGFLSCPSSSPCSIAVGNAERKVVANGIDFFSQDSWKVTQRLDVNLGLRWDYFGPLHNGSKDLAEFVPGKGMVVQGNGLDSVFPPDRRAFAPRFGFAYQPTSKEDVVVRGGFGVFYDQINMNPFLDYRPTNGGADGLEDNPAGPSPVSVYGVGPFAAGSAGNPALGGFTWQTGKYLFPGVATCVSGNQAANPTDCLDPATGKPIDFSVFSVNQNFRTPYFFNYNLNVEKSIGAAAVAQIGYVGSVGRKLSVMLDINQIPGTLTDGNFAAQYPNFSCSSCSINQLNSVGTSNYNALQATLRIRSWHGLTSQFAYTWAHELDEVSEYRGPLPLDSNFLSAEYGNGDFDTRQNFSAFFTYDIPGSSHGPKILTHGWQVTGLMTFHGGQPLSEIRPGLNQIADPFAGVSHAFNKSGVTWYNPAAFCSPSPTCLPNTLLGTVARNSIYGPGFADVDLSVFKNIPVTERLKIQLRAEMFNVFNRINLASGPGSTSNGIDSDTIGDFNGAPGIGPGEAFNLQLAAKIIF